MGIICLERTNKLRVDTDKTNRFTPARESFLLNSFTFDPSYEVKSGFFCFDLLNYSEIQYILRKSHIEEDNQQLAQNLQLHISQIDATIDQYRDNKDKNMGYDSMGKQKQQIQNEIAQDYNVYQYNDKLQELSLRSEQSEKLINKQLDNVLNFQLVGAHLNDYDHMEDIPFQIYLNYKKVMTVMGSICQNKWRPTSPNQMSVRNFSADFLNLKNQSHVKIITHIQQQQIQCTIPINQMTFKYLIPVLQTSNLRTKQDNEPSGHIHFKIQYIDNYQKHKSMVLKDLLIRREGLREILIKIKEKQTNALLDKSIEIAQQNNIQSYKSDALAQI